MPFPGKTTFPLPHLPSPFLHFCPHSNSPSHEKRHGTVGLDKTKEERLGLGSILPSKLFLCQPTYLSPYMHFGRQNICLPSLLPKTPPGRGLLSPTPSLLSLPSCHLHILLSSVLSTSVSFHSIILPSSPSRPSLPLHPLFVTDLFLPVIGLVGFLFWTAAPSDQAGIVLWDSDGGIV